MLALPQTVKYDIGSHCYSLDDIEHGILRSNMMHPTSGAVAFKTGDERLSLAVPLAEFDPRIHFALVCGAQSCPPIRVYKGDNIAKGLSMATSTYLNQVIQVDLAAEPAAAEAAGQGEPGGGCRGGGKGKVHAVRLPKVCCWYFADFCLGAAPKRRCLAVLLFLSKQMEAGHKLGRVVTDIMSSKHAMQSETEMYEEKEQSDGTFKLLAGESCKVTVDFLPAAWGLNSA